VFKCNLVKCNFLEVNLNKRLKQRNKFDMRQTFEHEAQHFVYTVASKIGIEDPVSLVMLLYIFCYQLLNFL